MTMMQVFAGIDPKSKQPKFTLVHPFMANHMKGRYKRIDYKLVDKRMRHVRTYPEPRIGVHICKRSGLGIPVRNFSGPLIADANTRQVRRARERANQYAR